jgi:hypothetical protein
MPSSTPPPAGHFTGPAKGGRFVVDVRWNAEGALEGLIGPEGAGPAELVPFWGVAELVGLLQARIGPPGHGQLAGPPVDIPTAPSFGGGVE